MEVVGEQDEAEQLPAAPPDLGPESIQELSPVEVIGDDVLAGVPARHDMGDGPLELDPQLPGHDATAPLVPRRRGSPSPISQVAHHQERSHSDSGRIAARASSEDGAFMVIGPTPEPSGTNG